MNHQTPLTDDAIRSALARRASRGTPGELLEQILATTAVTTQRGQRPRILTWSGFRPAMAAAAVAVVVLGIVIGLARMTQVPDTASPSPSPAPPSQSLSPAGTGRADVFVRPFGYIIPAGSTLSAPLLNERVYDFVEGGGDRDSGLAGDGPPVGHGVAVVSAQAPLVHGTTDRIPLRTKPDEFLEDLRVIGRVTLGEPSPTVLDGRPALVATVQGGASDFHYRPGLTSAIYLPAGSRIVAADVDGITVVVVIWATDEDDMAVWLPTATAFVNSMTFDPVGP